MRQLTDEERQQVVAWYKEVKNISMVIRMFRKTFHRHPPTRETIKKLVGNYIESGSVARVRRRQSNDTLIRGEIGHGVVGAFEANPDLGIREASRMFDVSCSTIKRILVANSMVSRNAEKWKEKLKKAAEKRAKEKEKAKDHAGPAAAPKPIGSYSYLLQLLKIKKHQRHKGLLRCSYCSYKTQFRSCLIAHEKEHEKYNEVGRREPKVLRCRTCKAEVRDRRALKSHAKKHKLEANPVVRIQCPTAGKQSDAQVICFPEKECRGMFSNRARLKSRAEDEEEENPFECDLCPAAFKTESSLRRHTPSHLREHKCGICGTPFKEEHLLEIHASAHDGETPYCCHLCRRPFRSISGLRSHMKTHAGGRVEAAEDGAGEERVADRAAEQKEGDVPEEEETEMGTGLQTLGGDGTE
ncbi:zinc finger imprinted 3-like [Ornithodoros turicata]|uniref:zinc finger imprinted 3-like n=1 Tax=Ornithodoros turicata TaxID=34597 RepID=UPI003138E49B